jgi:hypothetical protein
VDALQTQVQSLRLINGLTKEFQRPAQIPRLNNRCQ